MKNVLFYLTTVLIWGSTWIGIKMQLGVVDPMISVTYRFGLAAVILLLYCFITRRNMRFTLAEHVFMFLQGILLFGFNYLFFYIAELSLASGLAAVVFSTILVMNVINGRIFLKTPVDRRVIFGGMLGLMGIVAVFETEITSFTIGNDTMVGVLCCVLATFFASLGNIISSRNQKQKIPVVQSNAFGMFYGSVAMFCCALLMGKTFQFDFSPVYIGSLLYLAIFGSIIAFGCYLTLVGNIGADRAAYATLLFPIVALMISTVWEGYMWSISSLSGVGLILLGNFWIIKKGGDGNEHKNSIMRRIVHKTSQGKLEKQTL